MAASSFSNKRSKMKRSERAKQFMPFAALKGYEEALRKKEHKVVNMPALTEDMKDELDYAFSKIEKNDIARIVYISDDECLEIHGMISRVDFDSRILKVVNTKIPFEDILRLVIDR